jgi:hypothetical protein
MRKPERHVHFDIDGIGIDAEHCSTPEHGQHRAV